MSAPDPYVGREQTKIKHFILRKYLVRFAHIVGFHWDTITYVDCFSGPWQSQSEELKDTSFAIALEELGKARQTHEGRGKAINLRAMFLERDPGAYAKLKDFADRVQGITVETRNSDLVGAIADILQFVCQGGRSSFPFFFIDPTGWTGFELNQIARLLRQQPGEVLINFMTDYINRFIDHPHQQTQESFAALFGSGAYKARLQGLVDHQDREDALLRAYAEEVQRTGGFRYTCAAIVFYPAIDRSYFHLVYATRDRKGVEVFKEAEQRAMEVQEQARAEAKQRRRVKKSGQPELFAGEEMPHSRPIDALRARYLDHARQKVLQLLRSRQPVPYEEVWDLALSFPLVWERDVKEWISEWKAGKRLRIVGMEPKQRVPRLDEDNVLVWQQPGQPEGSGQ